MHPITKGQTFRVEGQRISIHDIRKLTENQFVVMLPPSRMTAYNFSGSLLQFMNEARPSNEPHQRDENVRWKLDTSLRVVALRDIDEHEELLTTYSQ